MVDWNRAVWNAICKLYDLNRSDRFWTDQLMSPRRMEEIIADSGCDKDSKQDYRESISRALSTILYDSSFPKRITRVGHGEYKLTEFGLVKCKWRIAREKDPENKVLRERFKKEWTRLYEDWDSTVR